MNISRAAMKHRRQNGIASHDMLQVMMDLQEKGERFMENNEKEEESEFERDAKLGTKIDPARIMTEEAVAQSAVLFFIAGEEEKLQLRVVKGHKGCVNKV